MRIPNPFPAYCAKTERRLTRFLADRKNNRKNSSFSPHGGGSSSKLISFFSVLLMKRKWQPPRKAPTERKRIDYDIEPHAGFNEHHDDLRRHRIRERKKRRKSNPPNATLIARRDNDGLTRSGGGDGSPSLPSHPHTTTFTAATVALQQEQSPIMRLPAEVREMIWEYYMGYKDDVVLYVARNRATLENRWRSDGDYGLSSTAAKFLRQRPLSLALTCRAVYAETIQKLYSSNTFYFCSEHAVRVMDCYLSAANLQAIRSLKILLMPLNPPRLADPRCLDVNELWFEFFDALRSLGGLRTLDVKIITWAPKRLLFSQEEAGLLRQFDRIETPRPWTLRVDWPKRKGVGFSPERFRLERISPVYGY